MARSMSRRTRLMFFTIVACSSSKSCCHRLRISLLACSFARFACTSAFVNLPLYFGKSTSVVRRERSDFGNRQADVWINRRRWSDVSGRRKMATADENGRERAEVYGPDAKWLRPTKFTRTIMTAMMMMMMTMMMHLGKSEMMIMTMMAMIFSGLRSAWEGSHKCVGSPKCVGSRTQVRR